MSELIGALNVQDRSAGYWLEIQLGGPADYVSAVRGSRVLVPGRRGLYTPGGSFEGESLTIRYHGIVFGEGADDSAAMTSFRDRFQALKAACQASTRNDVTLTSGHYSASAGFVRFAGPTIGPLRKLDIEFEATDPPEWTAFAAPSYLVTGSGDPLVTPAGDRLYVEV